MTTSDFIRGHRACRRGAEWALSISEDMADVWDALVNQEKHEWLLWTATRPGVLSDTAVRKLACRFVRETPVGDGTVWDLLEDERSREAVEVAERYAGGDATDAELFAAYTAACAAADVAHADTSDAAWAAYCAASATARDAAVYFTFCATVAKYTANAAAYSAKAAAYAANTAAAAAYTAQVRMISELGNPFKEESESC